MNSKRRQYNVSYEKKGDNFGCNLSRDAQDDVPL